MCLKSEVDLIWNESLNWQVYMGPKADNLPFKDCADDESPYSKSGFVMFYVHYVHEGAPHGQQMHPRLCCVCYGLISQTSQTWADESDECWNGRYVHFHIQFNCVSMLYCGYVLSLSKLFSPHTSCMKGNKPQMGTSAQGYLGICKKRGKKVQCQSSKNFKNIPRLHEGIEVH